MEEHGLPARAISFAALAHDGQFRKGSRVPYIVHPAETMGIAATLTTDEDVLAAAALHDVVEDCGVTLNEIEKRFGTRVALLVDAESEKKERDAAASWQRRKLRTITRLRTAPMEVLILTLSDKLSNLRSIDRDLRLVGPSMWDKFNQKNASMHKWYYESIRDALAPLRYTDAYIEYDTLLKKIF